MLSLISIEKNNSKYNTPTMSVYITSCGSVCKGTNRANPNLYGERGVCGSIHSKSTLLKYIKLFFLISKNISLFLFWCFRLGKWAIMGPMGTCPNQGSCQFVTLPSLEHRPGRGSTRRGVLGSKLIQWTINFKYQISTQAVYFSILKSIANE